MKAVLVLLALCLAPVLAFAQPATVKEVLAVEGKWKVNPRLYDEVMMSRGTFNALHDRESATAFIARLAAARSDSERRHASRIAKGNWTLLASYLASAEKIDAAKAKSLRDVLDRIAKAPAAAASDQAELKRLLDSVR